MLEIVLVLLSAIHTDMTGQKMGFYGWGVCGSCTTVPHVEQDLHSRRLDDMIARVITDRQPRYASPEVSDVWKVFTSPKKDLAFFSTTAGSTLR